MSGKTQRLGKAAGELNVGIQNNIRLYDRAPAIIEKASVRGCGVLLFGK